MEERWVAVCELCEKIVSFKGDFPTETEATRRANEIHDCRGGPLIVHAFKERKIIPLSQ